MFELADIACRWAGILLALLVLSIGAGALVQEFGSWLDGEGD